MRYKLLLILLILPSLVYGQVNLDADFNGFVDTVIGGTNAGTQAGAQTNLGLAIGSDVQAWSPFLQYIANLTPQPEDKILFFDTSTQVIDFLSVGTNLSIDDKTLNATGGGGSAVFVNGVQIVDPDFRDNASILFTNPAGSTVNSTLAQSSVFGSNLNATNAPTDNYVASFDQTTGGFTWILPLDPAANLTFSGDNTFSGSNNFTGPANTFTNITLPSGSVLQVTLADGIVNESKLDATNVPTAGQVLTYDQTSGGFTWADDKTDPGPNSIDNTHIVDNAVTTAKIIDEAITEPKLSVTNLPSDGQILSYNQASGQFTWVVDQTTDINPGANIDFTGNNTHAGTEVFNGITTFTNVVNMPADTNFPADSVDEPVLSVTNAGSDGQVLSYNQAGSNFTWIDQAQGGGGGTSATPQMENIVVRDPADTDEWLIFKSPSTITLSAIDCIIDAGTSVAIDILECDSSGATCLSNATATCTPTGVSGSITDAIIDPGDWVKLDVVTVTGTVGALTATITNNSLMMENFVAETPVAAEEWLWFKAPYDLTIANVHCISEGGTSTTISIQECDASGGTCAPIDDTSIVCSTTGGADDGNMSNASIDAGDWVKFGISAVDGSVNSVSASIYH